MSSEDKSEKASKQKLKKTKEQGQVTRSKDLATAIGLITSLQIIIYLTPNYLNKFNLLFIKSFQNNFQNGSLDNLLSVIFTDSFYLLISMILPLLIIPLLIIFSSIIPGGLIFSTKNLIPKLDKLNPIKNLSKFFQSRHYLELLMSIIKILFIILIVYFYIKNNLNNLVHLSDLPLSVGIKSGVKIFVNGLLITISVFIILALIDIPLQTYLFLKNQRMTKQEVKQEHQNSEGKPEIKSRIKRIQQQLAKRNIKNNVPKANAIIINPEHYSVAIAYNLNKASAPFVLAKGLDEMAFYIREIAKQNNIEIVNAPPLARAIYNTSQVNQQIPASLYYSVACVLHYVLQIKAFKQGRQNQKPFLPNNLKVPKNLSDPK